MTDITTEYTTERPTDNRFSTYRPDGDPTADRWAGALHLFDDDGPATVREETPAERWERAALIFDDKK